VVQKVLDSADRALLVRRLHYLVETEMFNLRELLDIADIMGIRAYRTYRMYLLPG
jgi:hypothetical protein